MVLDIKTGNEWQFLSKDGSMILPWYTRTALDILENIDLSDKIVFEYGIGISTLFYAHKAKMICGVDSNKEWIENVTDTLLHYNLLSKASLKYEEKKQYYINVIYHEPHPDIIIVDGVYRDECTLEALKFVNKGSIAILDNWLQNSVEVASQEVQDEVNKYPHTIYKQEGHDDWQTCIVKI